MPEPEADGPDPGSPPRRDPVVYAVLVIAVGLGLAAASGSVFDGSGTTASVREAVTPAIIGGLVGAAICAALLGVIRALVSRHWPSVRPFALTAIVSALGLGALAGASMASTDAMPDSLVTSEGAVTSGGAATAIPTGPVAAAGVVVLIDRDGDGMPDTFEGARVLGFDVDDDDVVDGLLQWCGSRPDPLVEERAGYLAIDLECDSTVDHYLAYEDDRVLSEFLPSALTPSGDDGVGVDTLITIGLVIMLLALLAALGYFLSRQARRVRPLERGLIPLSPGLLAAFDEPVDADMVADLLQASLEDVLAGADPRAAIRVAYGTLLDGLALIGLPRRPEEGPDEHIERCLQAAELPARPIRALLELFALARFSSHAITEEHRSRAIEALDVAIVSVRRLEVVG